ncbi:epoxyqueuosine reductase QueH [Sporomusa sp.]|uniref:epoxyqueuosine reductase QueH n=1 Tax=Sporomusa sp. TaxID=2078658 RepID=UPI002BD60777|nr:epoxyqueuosine reductase QueH [Sporomusa sp.]MDF2874283.1 queH [Sporomusa sp.]HWR09426.1 epoxyqueuosine reductase QueH [Sporomusa sp.]
MRMLLHVCCGPCAVFPLKHLQQTYPGAEITGYFYNPNIHPYKEFMRRLDTLKNFAGKIGINNLIINESYTLEEFLRQALATPGGRCRYCYDLRMLQTARYAKEHGFDCFSTTLLVSPYQQHELIKEAAEAAARAEGVDFCYADFRTGWQEGVKISRELEMYRQPYCGCVFSEKDRYYKPGKVPN